MTDASTVSRPTPTGEEPDRIEAIFPLGDPSPGHSPVFLGLEPPQRGGSLPKHPLTLGLTWAAEPPLVPQLVKHLDLELSNKGLYCK